MSSVSGFMSAVDQSEEAYEFMISYAGQGFGREIATQDVREIRAYLEQFRNGLVDAVSASRAIPEKFDLEEEDHYYQVVDGLESECEEAVEILDPLIAQERNTPQQVDNLNGRRCSSQ